MIAKMILRFQIYKFGFIEFYLSIEGIIPNPINSSLK